MELNAQLIVTELNKLRSEAEASCLLHFDVVLRTLETALEEGRVEELLELSDSFRADIPPPIGRNASLRHQVEQLALKAAEYHLPDVELILYSISSALAENKLMNFGNACIILAQKWEMLRGYLPVYPPGYCG
jgi:hypothetical protein